MKYLFFYLIAVIGLSSCKKDYTCTCTDVNGTQFKANDIRSTKKKAESNCDYYKTIYQGSGITCSLQ